MKKRLMTAYSKSLLGAPCGLTYIKVGKVFASLAEHSKFYQDGPAERGEPWILNPTVPSGPLATRADD